MTYEKLDSNTFYLRFFLTYKKTKASSILKHACPARYKPVVPLPKYKHPPMSLSFWSRQKKGEMPLNVLLFQIRKRLLPLQGEQPLLLLPPFSFSRRRNWIK